MLLPVVVEGALRLERGLALRALEAVVERRHVALARVLHRDVRVLRRQDGMGFAYDSESGPTGYRERNCTLLACP